MSSAVEIIQNTPSDQAEIIAELSHTNAELQRTIALQQRQIQQLTDRLQYVLHGRFGRSSERFDGLQSDMFSPGTDEQPSEQSEPELEQITYTRKKGGRHRPPKDLPRVRIEHDLPEREKRCGCGSCLERIGEQTSEQYDVIPPVFRVLEHVRFKYACPVCEEHGVTTAPKTTPDPLPRHQVSPGLLAWLGTSKYVDGLPLHRITNILAKRFGVKFTSTTLSQWMIKSNELLFKPLLAVMEKRLLQVDYLHADETTVQVLDEPERYAWQKSYFWIRLTGTGPPILLVNYSPSRGG